MARLGRTRGERNGMHRPGILACSPRGLGRVRMTDEVVLQLACLVVGAAVGWFLRDLADDDGPGPNCWE